MRLWHYEIIQFLPKSQLLAQWRELNSIFVRKPKHILINYVYTYPKRDLFIYSGLVIGEMYFRGYNIRSLDNYNKYFKDIEKPVDFYIPFEDHHTDRYLLQCFYNLQEKYDCGQKDFTEKQYKELEQFVKKEINKNGKQHIPIR